MEGDSPEFLDLVRGLKPCSASALLLAMARIPKVRRVCLHLAFKLERGQFHSVTARRILLRHYGVSIGAYSYGTCFIPGEFPSGVTVGRYVSIAKGVSIFLRNHPIDFLSTHPFFFNRRLGVVERDLVEFGKLTIGHDAWIGERVTITPKCRRIGIGSIVGAGSVVTKDVPDFMIVAGAPARPVRPRFDEETANLVRKSEWWKHSIADLKKNLKDLTTPLSRESLQRICNHVSV